MSKTKNDPPESSRLQGLTADDSGDFPLDPASMSPEVASLFPLLKKSVEHMKKSNGFVKTTNKELIQLNANQATQNKLLKVLMLGMALLWAALAVGLWQSYRGLVVANAVSVELSKTNVALGEMVTAQKDTAAAAKDTKKAVEEKPSITVKTDATGTPTAVVVEPPSPTKPPPPPPSPRPKKGDPPPTPKGKKPPSLEFPLGPPKKKK